MGWEKDINGVVYFWQWLLYTHVIGVVESPTTVYMRDDWEKLSDEKSSCACACRMGQASWVTRKVVCMHVVAVLRIVHELWVVSHESFTCFTTSAFTLYTYYIELCALIFMFVWWNKTSTFNYMILFFLFVALQMSIPPQLSPASVHQQP